jgi:hypothetical protein
MISVTSTSAVVSAAPAESPRSSSAPETGTARRAAPKAADRKPARVTPTCTAARKRLGSATRCATRAPRRPFSAIARAWLSRRLTSASSVPANTPPMRMKTATRTMSSQGALTARPL